MILRAIALFIISSLCINAKTQERYVNKTFPFPLYAIDSTIKSLTINPAKRNFASPIISLNSNEQVTIMFDDLRNDPRDLKYRLVHCTYNWLVSSISFYDFADGLPDDFITDYDFSQNFGQQYIHYKLQIPNDNVDLNVSGNYKVEIFNADDPGKTLAEVGFMVYDSKLAIQENMHRAGNADLRYAGQELDFKIIPQNYLINEPYTKLHTVLLQNFNAERAVEISPLFVKPDELDFDYDMENVFQGGNEYRELDLRRLTPSRFIAKVDNSGNIPQFTSVVHEKRAYLNYKSERDINGQTLIKVDDPLFDNILSAEYVKVNVRLNYGYQIDGDIYVFGELSNWQFLPEFKLTYNESKAVYESDLLLKQGYYNFVFAVPDSKGGDAFSDTFWTIEGSHHETENSYIILVYDQMPGTYFDALIGVKLIGFPKTE